MLTVELHVLVVLKLLDLFGDADAEAQAIVVGRVIFLDHIQAVTDAFEELLSLVVGAEG